MFSLTRRNLLEVCHPSGSTELLFSLFRNCNQGPNFREMSSKSFEFSIVHTLLVNSCERVTQHSSGKSQPAIWDIKKIPGGVLLFPSEPSVAAFTLSLLIIRGLLKLSKHTRSKSKAIQSKAPQVDLYKPGQKPATLQQISLFGLSKHF